MPRPKISSYFVRPLPLLFLGLPFLFLFRFSLAAQAPVPASLRGTFWFDLDLNLVVSPQVQSLQSLPSQEFGQELPLKLAELKLADLIKKSQLFVLQEISYVFHGIIYGFQVVYRPPDRFYSQDETFVVVPGKPQIIDPNNLEIYRVVRDGKRFYYSVRKQLSRFESSNITAWQQADKKNLYGSGAALFAAAAAGSSNLQNLQAELMIQLRQAAIDNAIKKALRNYFRRALRRKPRQIRANVALAAVPKIAVGNGKILASVRLHLGTYSVENYAKR